LPGGESVASMPSRITNPGVSEKANGRLGLSHIPRSVVQGAPYPMQVRLPGVRVISLIAGGMSVFNLIALVRSLRLYH